VTAGVTVDQQRELVNIHNNYRRKVAKGEEPKLTSYPASDMMELVWDDELARGAQLWANQCNFHHDSNTICRFRLGQNLYESGSIGEQPPAWDAAILAWYEEVEKLKSGEVLKKFRSRLGVGHFSQVVWSTTEFVGCGRIVYKGYLGHSNVNSDYYVCNYGPAGNRGGHPVYSQGPPCSQCPKATTCVDGLCRRNMSEDVTTVPTAVTGPSTSPTTSTEQTTQISVATGVTASSPGGDPAPPAVPVNSSASSSCDLKSVVTYLNWCQYGSDGHQDSHGNNDWTASNGWTGSSGWTGNNGWSGSSGWTGSNGWSGWSRS